MAAIIQTTHHHNLTTNGIVEDRRTYVSQTNGSEINVTSSDVDCSTLVSTPSTASTTVGWSAVLLSMFQWLVFAFGTGGNLLVLCVMAWRRHRSQLVTQLFIGSLSLSGLGLMLSMAWVMALQTIDSNYRFGLVNCKLQFGWQTLAMNASIWTLVALAVERYCDLCVTKGGYYYRLVLAVID